MEENSSKIMNRQDFLKIVGGFLAGTVLLRAKNLFNWGIRQNPWIGTKEAKYFRQGDHLAG